MSGGGKLEPLDHFILTLGGISCRKLILRFRRGGAEQIIGRERLKLHRVGPGGEGRIDQLKRHFEVAVVIDPGFGNAEWGFALGSSLWGTGVFQEGAELMMQFAFETVGVHRLEARAALRNLRGNGALKNIGAKQEGILRKSFQRNGEYLDQALWTVLDEDWRAKAIWGGSRMIMH